jgi:hypothetical protein
VQADENEIRAVGQKVVEGRLARRELQVDLGGASRLDPRTDHEIVCQHNNSP